MKKFFAMMVVAAFAITFTTQAVLSYQPNGSEPYANDPYYTNTDSRGDVYWGLPNWIKDRVHGKPGNPHQGFIYNIGGSTVTGTWTAFPYIQFDQYGDFMWQTGQIRNIPNPQTQLDLIEDGCQWYDYPEYVGCTEYFYLFVYEPLCIVCVCLDYRCIGIFTIPSYHTLWDGSGNPFLGGRTYACTWDIRGQKNWYVVLSGEILYVQGSGVVIDWKWFGQPTTLNSGLAAPGPNVFQEENDNWHKLIQLDNTTGFYYVGLVAKSVSVATNASNGVHAWEATLSGFYYF